MAHLSDLDWLTPGEEALKKFRKGDEVKAKVLTIDVEKERIGLGLKQLDDDPFQGAEGRPRPDGDMHRHGGERPQRRGRNIRLAPRRHQALPISPATATSQRPSRFAPGDKVDAKLLQIDRNNRRVSLSIKALEVQEEKQAVEEYGSTDSGASLGDILGAALDRKTQEEAARAAEEKDAPDES